MDITPRDYQEDALAALRKGRTEGDMAQLVVLPTGSGKTIVAAIDIRDTLLANGGRALFMAHRDELIKQGAQKTQRVWPEANIGRVKGAEFNDVDRDVTVASVQTIHRENRLRPILDAGPIDLLYIDEAHHAAAPTYQKVISAVREANPAVTIVGLTATPVRADATKLDSVFDTVTYQKSMLDLIAQGYLADIELRRIYIDVSLDGVPVRRGDLKSSDLRKVLAMPSVMQEMVAAWKEHASGKRTLAFTVDVAHARELCNAFDEAGVKARMVHGSTPMDERRATFDDFQKGEFDVLLNCAILCLDSQTEILTDKGWTSIDEMSFSHKVANYEATTGAVTFEEPLDIVRRPRGPEERMVSMKTRQRSIRVTEGHRILYRTLKGGQWNKKAARDLVNRAIRIPVSTITDPEVINVEQEDELSDQQIRRRISAQAYNLRKNNSFEYEASFAEAEKRVLRRQSLRYAQPYELTSDECTFIGFWIGDGSRSKLQSGGVEYTLRQPNRQPRIIEWCDELLKRLNLDFVRRQKEGYVSWSLSRGTGGGPQERNGLYRIEPFLDKLLNNLFWGLNEKQFDSFVHGLWMADGDHGYGGVEKYTRCGHRRIMIYQSDEQMLSNLQALAVCRGWKSSLRIASRRNEILGKKLEKESVVYYLGLTKRSEHNAAKKYSLQLEDNWVDETVWCVRTRTSNLITRRKGSVTFMGNTEGYDDEAWFDPERGEYAPALECIAMFTATLSQSRYIQMVGRGTRPAPNKDKLLLLDFGYNSQRHHLVQLPHLFGLEALELSSKERKEREEEEDPDHIPSILAAVREARQVDVHQAPPRAGFHWSHSDDGFILKVGQDHGFLLIRKAAEDEHEGKWRVWMFKPSLPDDYDDLENKPPPWTYGYKRNCLTREPLEFDWAFGLAEDAMRDLHQARSQGVKTMTKTTLNQRDASWHELEPTEKQLGVLKRSKVVPKTRGEAMDMINAQIIRRIISGIEPATAKQIKFMNWKHISYPPKCSKDQARKLISEYKKEQP